MALLQFYIGHQSTNQNRKDKCTKHKSSSSMFQLLEITKTESSISQSRAELHSMKTPISSSVFCWSRRPDRSSSRAEQSTSPSKTASFIQYVQKQASKPKQQQQSSMMLCTVITKSFKFLFGDMIICAPPAGGASLYILMLCGLVTIQFYIDHQNTNPIQER